MAERVQGLPTSAARDEEMRQQVAAIQSRLLAKSASMPQNIDDIPFAPASSPPLGEIVAPEREYIPMALAEFEKARPYGWPQQEKYIPVPRQRYEPAAPIQQPSMNIRQMAPMQENLETRVFPYVGQEEYDHPYYEEAMQYQERIARQSVNSAHSLRRALQQEAALKMMQNKVSLLRLIKTD